MPSSYLANDGNITQISYYGFEPTVINTFITTSAIKGSPSVQWMERQILSLERGFRIIGICIFSYISLNHDMLNYIVEA